MQQALYTVARELHAQGKPSFSLPMVTMVDYCGHRVFVASLLPFGSTTLKYGSADGGKTFHCDDPEVSEVMSSIGQQLNLKQHVYRPTNTKLYGPVDIEVHRAKDGRSVYLQILIYYPQNNYCLFGLNIRIILEFNF